MNNKAVLLKKEDFLSHMMVMIPEPSTSSLHTHTPSARRKSSSSSDARACGIGISFGVTDAQCYKVSPAMTVRSSKLLTSPKSWPNVAARTSPIYSALPSAAIMVDSFGTTSRSGNTMLVSKVCNKHAAIAHSIPLLCWMARSTLVLRYVTRSGIMLSRFANVCSLSTKHCCTCTISPAQQWGCCDRIIHLHSVSSDGASVGTLTLGY